MKLIVGLGNPGTKYENTRHNVGFLAVDYFLNQANQNWGNKFEALITEMVVDGEKMIFAKPQTFMNLSGRSVATMANFYKINPETELLVVHDEKDLPFGTIKPAQDSSSAGHNGVQDIIDRLGTKNFARIRIGIETRSPDSPIPTDVFVLQAFTPDELTRLKAELFPVVKQQIEEFIQN